MADELMDLALEDSAGQSKPLRDWIKESPFTVLVTYRGDW
jgi:hypothetical protein